MYPCAMGRLVLEWWWSEGRVDQKEYALRVGPFGQVLQWRLRCWWGLWGKSSLGGYAFCKPGEELGYSLAAVVADASLWR